MLNIYFKLLYLGLDHQQFALPQRLKRKKKTDMGLVKWTLRACHILNITLASGLLTNTQPSS